MDHGRDESPENRHGEMLDMQEKLVRRFSAERLQ